MLDDIQFYVEAVMLQCLSSDQVGQKELFRLLSLLKHVGLAIEEVDIDLIEDAFYGLNCVINEHCGKVPLEPLCQPVDVMDLAKDKVNCPICLEDYVSKEDEDRQEEKPVQLLCEHIFGKRCLYKHFLENRLSCPFFNYRFNSDKYLPEPMDFESP